MPENFASFHYPTTKLAAARARTDCRKFLLTCGIPVDDDFADELTLVVDELVTNAVTHGRVPGTTGRQVRLTVSRDGDLFRVEVRDTQSDRMPNSRRPGTTKTGGGGSPSWIRWPAPGVSSARSSARPCGPKRSSPHRGPPPSPRTPAARPRERAAGQRPPTPKHTGAVHP